jgi:phosphatidylglycerol:prolipoprotein diacylglycerol transferase
MFPKLFTFKTPSFLHGFLPEELSIYSYGFFIALGALAGFLILSSQRKKFRLTTDELSSLLIWIIVMSFVGGKVFFFFEDPEKYIQNPKPLYSGGGFVFYGSLLFSLSYLLFWVNRKKIALRPFMDVIALMIPVVHMFGRIGCFFAGCCYGKVCSSSLGVVFTDPLSKARPLGTPLYPTQLYDVAINLVIILVLVVLRKRQKFSGQLLAAYIALYAIGRFINEQFRGDEARGFIFDGWFSHSQAISIGLIGFAVFLYIKWKAKGMVPEPWRKS